MVWDPVYVCVTAGRHASLVEFSAYMNSVVTFLVILYISHGQKRHFCTIYI